MKNQDEKTTNEVKTQPALFRDKSVIEIFQRPIPTQPITAPTVEANDQLTLNFSESK